MELFEHYVKSENILFKHARGKSANSGKEFHTYHEIILFMSGNAEFISESTHTVIKPNTLIVIPKETYHQVAVLGDPEDYHRCVINFNDVEKMLPMINKSLKEQILLPSSDDIDYLFKRLIKSIESENSELILASVLVLLLNEIEEKKSFYVTGGSQAPRIKAAIQYINDNISKKITVNDIAKACMTSSSSLCRIFKKEMNISLYKFILRKRLITARQKILSGESATAAALDTGFSDYSGFYKQYKKMFNTSPSESDINLSKQ